VTVSQLGPRHGRGGPSRARAARLVRPWTTLAGPTGQAEAESLLPRSFGIRAGLYNRVPVWPRFTGWEVRLRLRRRGDGRRFSCFQRDICLSLSAQGCRVRNLRRFWATGTKPSTDGPFSQLWILPPDTIGAYQKVIVTDGVGTAVERIAHQVREKKTSSLDRGAKSTKDVAT
jgi:hypothetical protein